MNAVVKPILLLLDGHSIKVCVNHIRYIIQHLMVQPPMF
uniref:Uncharacterized protein n=1 Tax=Siphoviridae sp. ctxMM9 TaxID=2827973 RepID=A0A8S5T722_9CAUD|nr:MAG TPA: hypothetical protein [Siphoviridae sp. ctxMM9]